MKIYTKTGDRGETGLFGGPRVRKSDPRVEAYGETDELNAAIGAARALVEDPEIDRQLAAIQDELFAVGDGLTAANAEAAMRASKVMGLWLLTADCRYDAQGPSKVQ